MLLLLYYGAKCFISVAKICLPMGLFFVFFVQLCIWLIGTKFFSRVVYISVYLCSWARPLELHQRTLSIEGAEFFTSQSQCLYTVEVNRIFMLNNNSSQHSWVWPVATCLSLVSVCSWLHALLLQLSPALRNRFTEIWCPSVCDRSDLVDIIAHNFVRGMSANDWFQHCSSELPQVLGTTMLDFCHWFQEKDFGRR